MGLAEDLERAEADRPKPVLVDIAIGETPYQVEVRRLDGMEWALIMVEAPPTDEGSIRLGYSPPKAALIACRRHARLLNADGEHVRTLGTDADGSPIPVNWQRIFNALSGIEIQAIASTWWALNIGDPNEHVEALKKASAGGSKTS